MRIEVVDAEVLASRAAEAVAAALHAAVAAHGSASLALSGGRTPTQMLAELAALAVPWSRIHVFQVDERLVPDGDPERNLSALRSELLDRVAVPPAQVHPVPVAGSADPGEVAASYARTLRSVAGVPAVLDVVQLGLGADGHTASLVPDDPVLEVADQEVAVTGPYQGSRRITLTLPVLRRARQILWLVAGPEKADAVASLVAGDVSIPAALVPRDRAVLMVDPAAAAKLPDRRATPGSLPPFSP